MDFKRIKTKKISKKTAYQHAIMDLSPVPLLYIMAEKKEAEEFEECQIIISVIKNFYKKHKIIDAPTEFSKEEFIFLKNEFEKFEISGEKVNLKFWDTGKMENHEIPMYAEICKNYVADRISGKVIA